MDMQWTPPGQEHTQCNFLQNNFLTCLQEKIAKDDVPTMKCNTEHILWFNVECPDRFNEYRDPIKLRNIFLQTKKGKAIDRPAYVRL